MSTKRVRFEFQCPSKLLTHKHAVPTALLTSRGQNSPSYQQLFMTAIQPIVFSHQAECTAAAGPTCQSCNGPKKTVLQTPMTWLHIVEDPFIRVVVTPVCGKQACEMKARGEIQKMMMEIDAQATREGIAGPEATELLACAVCGKVEGAQKCGRCKAVSYCSKDHQKEDWKSHKAGCRAPVS